MNASSLTTLPSNELIKIIYRYNAEVKELNLSISNLNSENVTLKSHISQLNDQVGLHKEHSEKLNKDLHAVRLVLKEKQISLANSELILK